MRTLKARPAWGRRGHVPHGAGAHDSDHAGTVALGQRMKRERIINCRFSATCLQVACVAGGGLLWGTTGVAAGTSVASVIACVLFIPAGLRLTLMAPAAVVPMLAVDFSCAVLGSFLLLAVRVSVGWSIQTAWIVLFALGGAAAFIGLWLIVPGGKKRLLDYYNAARRVFVPRVESTPAH